MALHEFYYHWGWQLKASPEQLWPLVADTNRFNRDTGIPRINWVKNRVRENAYRFLRMTRFGVPIEWTEEPFEWVRPYRFGVVRRYSKGPVKKMRTLTEMAVAAGGGTKLTYHVWISPRDLSGLLAIPLQVGLLSARAFDKVFRKYGELALAGTVPEEIPATVKFSSGGRERLESLRRKLLERNANPAIVSRLVALVETADELDISRMRPYAIADRWQLPRQAVLEVFLWATRLGLLDFRWDLLCPLCRGASDSSPTLDGIQRQVHCDSCNIDYNVNFNRSVELTFRPNPAIRQTNVAEFCVGGPQLTPHIIAQQLLKPGDEREISLPLEPGRYRVRTLEQRGGQLIAVTTSGATNLKLVAGEEDWPEEEQAITGQPTMQFCNRTPDEQLFVLERMSWNDQATTAAEVTSLQLFRDLFSNEALRPGEQISVGNMAILFTDLRGSTRLYREIGDAPAFGKVMNHFDILKQAIAGEQGALVKTIGDAVMAVFISPASALRASLKAQAELAALSEPLNLRAGIHYGPCIAVNLNDRLDYFGSTVNLAARLENFSTGQDIIVSEALFTDPEVAAMAGSLRAMPFETNVKGFEGELFKFWRVTSGQPGELSLEIPLKTQLEK